MLRLCGVVALATALAPRRGVQLRQSYLDDLPPAAEEASPAAAPPAVAEDASPVVDETPQALTLSDSMLGEFSSRSTRNQEVARLQTQLERSQMRRRQVEEVIGEEVAALRLQLEREVQAERDRAAGAAKLQDELAAAKKQKMDKCRAEEALLVQLQDVQQRTTEEAVAASLAAAIETKAGLVAIELVLVEDVAECASQISVEQAEIEKRVAALEATLASLPAADDVEALRLYSWGQVEALQAELAASAAAIAETEASVGALRQRIGDALDQRDAVLGAAPLGAAAPPAAPAAPAVAPPARAEVVPTMDLEALDDAELADATKAAAGAAGAALGTLGKTLLAFAGNFQASEDRKSAAGLLSEASAAASKVGGDLAQAPADASQADAAALAKAAATDAGDVAGKLGGAAAKTASAAKLAAEQSELGAASRDALTALGNTVASAGLLALRTAQGAANKASGAASETTKTGAPADFD